MLDDILPFSFNEIKLFCCAYWLLYQIPFLWLIVVPHILVSSLISQNILFYFMWSSPSKNNQYCYGLGKKEWWSIYPLIVNHNGSQQCFSHMHPAGTVLLVSSVRVTLHRNSEITCINLLDVVYIVSHKKANIWVWTLGLLWTLYVKDL